MNISTAKDILPPMDEYTRWRVIIAFIVLALLVHVAWACGWLPGVAGLARADEIDAKIDAKLRPIETKLEELTTNTDDLAKLVMQSLKSQYSEEIRKAVTVRCNTTDPAERRRINDTIERYQQDYMAVAKERYPMPGCDEI